MVWSYFRTSAHRLGCVVLATSCATSWGMDGANGRGSNLPSIEEQTQDSASAAELGEKARTRSKNLAPLYGEHLGEDVGRARVSDRVPESNSEPTADVNSDAAAEPAEPARPARKPSSAPVAKTPAKGKTYNVDPFLGMDEPAARRTVQVRRGDAAAAPPQAQQRAVTPRAPRNPPSTPDTPAHAKTASANPAQRSPQRGAPVPGQGGPQNKPPAAQKFAQANSRPQPAPPERKPRLERVRERLAAWRRRYDRADDKPAAVAKSGTSPAAAAPATAPRQDQRQVGPGNSMAASPSAGKPLTPAEEQDLQRLRADVLMERAQVAIDQNRLPEALKLAMSAQKLEAARDLGYGPDEERPSDLVAYLRKLEASNAVAAKTPQKPVQPIETAPADEPREKVAQATAKRRPGSNQPQPQQAAAEEAASDFEMLPEPARKSQLAMITPPNPRSTARKTHSAPAGIPKMPVIRPGQPDEGDELVTGMRLPRVSANGGPIQVSTLPMNAGNEEILKASQQDAAELLAKQAAAASATVAAAPMQPISAPVAPTANVATFNAPLAAPDAGTAGVALAAPAVPGAAVSSGPTELPPPPQFPPAPTLTAMDALAPPTPTAAPVAAAAGPVLAAPGAPAAHAAITVSDLEVAVANTPSVKIASSSGHMTLVSLVGFLMGVCGLFGLGIWRRMENRHYAPQRAA